MIKRVGRQGEPVERQANEALKILGITRLVEPKDPRVPSGDAVVVSKRIGAFCVIDRVGGSVNGPEVKGDSRAAGIVARAVEKRIEDVSRPIDSTKLAVEFLLGLQSDAKSELEAVGRYERHSAEKYIGATLTAVLVGKVKIAVLNVGDCRAVYFPRKGKTYEPPKHLTLDDTRLVQILAAREGAERELLLKQQKAMAAMEDPSLYTIPGNTLPIGMDTFLRTTAEVTNMVSSFASTGSVEGNVEIYDRSDLGPGLLLLMSDGTHEVCSDPALLRVLNGLKPRQNPAEAVRDLVIAERNRLGQGRCRYKIDDASNICVTLGQPKL